MPQVPLMVVPQAQQSQLPGAYADDRGPMKRGDAQGQTMQALGAGLMKSSAEVDHIAMEQAATLNESTVKDLHSQAADAVSKILYDPDSGYMNQRGKNAISTYDAAAESIKSAMADLSEKATNPEQQRMFAAAAQQTMVAALGTMRQHASQQNNVYAIDASKAREGAAADQVRASFNPLPGADNSLYNQALATMAIERRDQAQRLGMDADQTSAYIAEGRTKAYVGVIDRLVSNEQTKAAKAYFDQVGDALPVDVADKVRQVLKVSASKDDALSLALDVKGRISDIGKQEADLDQQYKAGKITSEVHEMALQKLRSDNAQRRGEEAERDKSVLGQVWDMHNKNPNMTVADLPTGTLNYIKTRGLGTHVDSILRPDADPKADDTQQFVTLMHMAADDPLGFANTDLLKLGLTKQNVQRFAAMQAAIDKKDATSQSVNKLMSGAVRTTVGELKAAGINPGSKAGTTAAEDYAGFQSAAFQALQDEVTVRQASKLKPMSDEDARKIVLGVVKKQALSGTGVLGFFKTEAPAFKLLEKVPEAERSQITQALRSKGKAVTPAAIIDLYNQAHP